MLRFKLDFEMFRSRRCETSRITHIVISIYTYMTLKNVSATARNAQKSPVIRHCFVNKIRHAYLFMILFI